MPPRSRSDVFRLRSGLLSVFFCLGFFIIGFRLFQLQVINGQSARELAENQHLIYKKLYPIRGEIKIFDGKSKESFLLATNIKKPLVYAVPSEILTKTETADQLSRVLNLPAQDILQKIIDDSPGRKYVPLKKQLTETEEAKIKLLNLAGIYFDIEDIRFYPEKNLLSQTLGFVGYKTNVKEGLYGLEKYFEKALAGKTGELRQERDITGAWIFGSQREVELADDGVNLILTIDKTIQFKAESLLREAVEKHGADSGSIVVANPKNGAILAIANFPDFNLNEFSKVENHALFLNKATLGNYEPGSVFKPLTMAAAVNEGKIGSGTIYEDTGKIEVDKHIIKNSDGKSHGQQTMTQVLEKSLNTGVVYAKEQIGNAKFLEYVKKFGFGKTTEIELPEGKGNLDNLQGNIKVNFHTASFGQGISVTPIQLIQAFTVLANGGKMMKPYIVQSQIFANGTVKETQGQVVAEVVSPQTANIIGAMLVNVVENGHGKSAQVPGYFIAGKTGTAQVPKKDGRGYEENNNIGSFIGYGPVENPRFLAIVRIDNPKSVKFAESTAAPTFGELAQFILNYLQVSPTREINK